jgi:large subunit ribosomal protein L5
MPRMLDRYRSEIAPQLTKELGRKNPHSVPRLVKVVVNMGVGKAVQDPKILEEVTEHLAMITGQKPVITKSRKSISQFKLREGMQIGACVTLRGHRMYEFLDRLINLVLPRVRDFRGINPKAFDGHGNYSLGLTDQVVFPEIQADKVKHLQGMNIAIVTTARNNEEGRALLTAIGMPFKRDEKK